MIRAILSSSDNASLMRYATYASVSAGALLIILKFFGWWVTHSVSLQASLIDSLLDVLASLINMVAIHHALKPPDKEHRFGHGKIESLAALAQAFFIGASSLWLLFEAKNHLFHTHQVESSEMGLLVMGVAMIITALLIWYQGYVVEKTGSLAIAADRVHYKSDLLINAAVFVSLLSVEFFHTRFIDPIFGVLIGLYILWTAWKISVHAFNVLMDRELRDEERQKILLVIQAHTEVRGVKDLRTRSSGLQTFVQFHLLLDEAHSLQVAHEIAQEVEDKIMGCMPESQVMIRLRPHAPMDKTPSAI